MEVFSFELYQALKQIPGHSVLLYKPRNPILGKPSTLELVCFIFGAMRNVLKYRAELDAVLLGDSVLTPLGFWVQLVCKRRGTKVIGTAHGNDIFFAQRRSHLSRAYAAILRTCCRNVDLLIANSLTTETAAKQLGFQKLAKVPLATSVRYAGVTASPRRVVLFAGRLIRYKGLAWFIKDVLPKVSDDISLEVAGPPWDKSEMDAALHSPRVKYLGSLRPEQLTELRANVLACVMPNLPPEVSLQDEGFGLSALEAPAVGTPVVATRCGGLTEAVTDGITGFLVEPLNADVFAEKLREISDWSPRERDTFASGARNLIRHYYNWERVAADYIALITPIAENEQPVMPPEYNA